MFNRSLSLVLMTFESFRSIGDSCIVTLVVAFSFLPHNFRRQRGPTNGNLLFYKCRLSGEDTQILPAMCC